MRVREERLRELSRLKGNAAADDDKWHDETFKLIEEQTKVEKIIWGIVGRGLTSQDFKGGRIKVYPPPKNEEVVNLGHKAQIIDQAGRECSVVLVGSLDIVFHPCPDKDEWASSGSPFGRGLIGRRTGDEIEVETPDGVEKFTVREISIAKELFNIDE